MPTLIRFLSILGILGGIGYGVIFLLAYSIEPKTRDMSVSVSQEKIVLKAVSENSDETANAQQHP